MKPGTMQIEFLPDGQLKVDTGDMSGPNHKQADDFIINIEKVCGGEVKKERKRQHHHHHQQEHRHQHS